MKYLGILFLLIGSCFAQYNGQDTKLPSGYKENPYTYSFGRVIGMTRIIDTQRNNKLMVNVRVIPVGVYSLYPGDSITFCGDVVDQFDFTSNDFVIITYTRRLTRHDCHDLLRIDVIDKVHKAHGDNPDE